MQLAIISINLIQNCTFHKCILCVKFLIDFKRKLKFIVELTLKRNVLKERELIACLNERYHLTGYNIYIYIVLTDAQNTFIKTHLC